MSEHFPAPWHVDPLSASVYATDVPKGPARVADMRGWGYLTGKGHGALALSENEAIDIQRANAAFLVKAVNNHDALIEALKKIAAENNLSPSTACQIARDALASVGIAPDTK